MNTSEWDQTVDLKIQDSSDIQTIESVLQYPTIELSSSGRIREAEAVINRVMEVAESNHTIERILERRHEVKDLAGKENQNSGSTIGFNAIPTGNPATSDHPDHSNGQYRQSVIGVSAYERIMSDQSIYAYAVRYGFFSLLLALVIAVIVVNLFT